jgi:hypothetical protein
MKNSVLIFAFLTLLFAEANAQKRSEEFQKLWNNFQEIKPKTTLNTPEVVALSQKTLLDDNLAHKYLWDKNPLIKPADTKSHAIGYFTTANPSIVILVFSKERSDKPGAFLVDARSFNIKNGKLISQFTNWGGFETNTQDSFSVFLSENKMSLIFMSKNSYGESKAIIIISEKGNLMYK